MDNIKQLREKIEWFITCGDRRCPTLSERYHRHLIKHHSLHRNQTPPSNNLPVRNKTSVSSCSNEKSTVSIEIHTKERYSLENEIMDWSKDLPIYHNPKFEELKQNAINELIENIEKLLEDKNTTELVLEKLENKIADNIYCIPLTYEQQKLFEKNLLQRFKHTKNSRALKIKSNENILYQEEENVSKVQNKIYSAQNSYIDIIKSISPVLLSDLKLTSTNSQLYKYTANSLVRKKEFKNISHKILSLRVCKSRKHKEIFQNKNIVELLNNTAVTAKYQNILKDTTFDIRNKLSVSNINIKRIADIREIHINTTTKVSRDSLRSCVLIYRSEDMNVKTNVLPITTDYNEYKQVECDVDSLKNELLSWLLEKESFQHHKIKSNKTNRAVAKISKTLFKYFLKNMPYSAMSKDVIHFLSKLVKPEFKNDTEILLKELIHRLYISLPKTENIFEKVLANNKTQASICTNIETDMLEYSLKKLILKYVVALCEEESLSVKEVFRILFKNKIQSMLDSKLCNKNSGIKDREKVLAFNLKIDIECIEILTEWLKSTTSNKTIANLETNSEILFDIIHFLKRKKDNVTEIDESNHNYKKIISDKLSSILQSNSKNTDKLVTEILQRHLRHSQKIVCEECHDQHRSDVVDDYLYLRGEAIVKDKLQFNLFLNRILKDIKYHCMCHLLNILTLNDFEYVKEIYMWLNNLPLLSTNDIKVHNKIVNMVADFINKIKINTQQQVDDTYITDFIKTLPLNKDKEIDIQLAALQLKKRLQYVDKNDHENKCENGVKEEKDFEIDIVTEIENWCQNLPIMVSDEKTTVILKQRLAWNLLKKIGELNMNFEYYRHDNNMLYENDVTLEIDTQLNNSPLSDKLDNTTDSLKKQLLNKFIHNFNAIKYKSPPERYIIHIRNLIELSLRSNANIKSDEDTVLLKKIRDGLVAISLLRQFETNNEESTNKYFLFLMEEICAYLQYAKMIFIVPFLLDLNKDLFTYDVFQYHSHPLIVKILKSIKTKYVLNNWIETLPIKKGNGVQKILQKYEMLTELTDLVIEIENKYNYNDFTTDEALMKCIQVLPLLSVTLQERLCVDLKNILTSTLHERNNYMNSTSENYNSTSNQNNSKPKLISYNPTDHNILDTTRGETNCSESEEAKTNHWYSLPPASTVNDNNTTNDSTVIGNINERKVIKLSQHELSIINYKDFEKGVDLKSSAIETSPIKQIIHNSSHDTSQHEPSMSTYEAFEKGVDFKSSLIELSPIKQKSDTIQIVEPNEVKSNNSLTKEQIESSCTRAPTSLHKSSSPIKFEAELEKNYRCVPDCKQQEANLTSSLNEIYPKKESDEKPYRLVMEQCNKRTEASKQENQEANLTSSLNEIYPKKESDEKPYRLVMEQCNKRTEASKQENHNGHETICKCHRKCLPCYLRSYRNICNSFPLRYPELHFWL